MTTTASVADAGATTSDSRRLPTPGPADDGLGPRPSPNPWRAAVALAALLPLYAAAMGTWAGSATTVFLGAVAGTGVLLAAGHRWMGWRSLGLAAEHLGAGARWGLGSVALVAAGALAWWGWSVATGAPLAGAGTTPDAEMAGGALAVRLLVVIPLGTAVFEELAFRGLLLGLWRRATSTVVAVAAVSASFGLWHVVPELHRLSAAGVRPDGVWATAVAVLPGVVATAAASALVLCPLRLRSRSLLAPVLLHAATNDLVLLLVWLR